jgi:hypothetical protein
MLKVRLCGALKIFRARMTPKPSNTKILLAHSNSQCGEWLLPVLSGSPLRLAEGETSRRSGEDAFEAGRVKFRFPNLKRFHEFSSPGWIKFAGFQRVSWILSYGRVQFGDQITCILVGGLIGGEENFDVGSLTWLGWVVAQKVALSEHVGENP